MQDAYAVESGKIGGWADIGYTGPGSNSTNWAQSAIFTYTAIDVNGDDAGWQATPTTGKLNDCDANEVWTLNAQYISSGDQQGNVGYLATGDDDCTALTPAWDKLDDGRSSS